MCLLHALHRRGYLNDHRVLVLDPAEKTGDDRTWCFWAKDEDPIIRELGPLVSASWSWLDEGPARRPLSPFTYHHLRSGELYRHVRAALASCANLQWLPLSVTAIHERGDHVLVEAGGRSFRASQVCSSRPVEAYPPEEADGLPLLWQTFRGWRVRFERPLPRPDAIRLMDFDIPQQGQCQFVYFLPTSPREALAEITRFGDHSVMEPEACQLLEAWILERFGPFEVLEAEDGAIPMTQRLQRVRSGTSRIIPIGTPAGAVKPTTGYAFHTMFLHAREIAAALAEGRPAPRIPRKGRFLFYDALLLDILSREPTQGARIFRTLFRRNAPGRILAFIDERSTWWQEAVLLGTLPWGPFLSALWRVRVWPRLSEPQSWRSGFAPALAGALLLPALFWPQAMQALALPALLLGMVFPGLPHGALDHCLLGSRPLAGWPLWRFVARYLALMAAVLLLWMLSPWLGLAVFLLSSAWHFGETDTREWGAFHPATALLQGLALLGYLLTSHPGELAIYLQQLGGLSLEGLPDGALSAMAVLSFAILLAIPLHLEGKARRQALGGLAVPVLGVFLPLLWAFGIYFVAQHSVRGWIHIRERAGMSTANMLGHSAPFTAGALLVLGLLAWLDRTGTLDIRGMAAWLFVFLAAISLPHIVLMHRFYGSRAA